MQYKSNPTVITKKFLNKILMVFFCRVSPISKKENPKCIKNTKAVQTIIHTLFTVKIVVSIIICVVSLMNRFLFPLF